MTVLWTGEDVLNAVRGAGDAGWQATGVSIDTRTLKPGDLYVALKGPVYDAHDFVAEALSKGAAAALVHKLPANLPQNAKLAMVPDTMTALEDLGRCGRVRTQAVLTGVTGSVGKTGSKEMLRLMLEACGPTFATQGSFNNHWGVPLSLAQLPQNAKWGVFELGMNHAGEMKALSKQVQPHVALITTIEPVHLEFFQSIEAIADAKAEVFLGMNSTGVAVLNRDNPQFARLVGHARTQGLQRILSFGIDRQADACLLDVKLGDDHSLVKARLNGKTLDYKLGAPGIHLVMNSLATLLAAGAAGADIYKCAAALEGYRPPQGRGLRETIALPGNGAVTVIDETYNASPIAVAAAIAVLGKANPTSKGRRLAALGDMRELGPTAPQLHAELAPAILAAGVDLVFCCGHNMQALHDALPADKRGGYTGDSQQLATLVAAQVRDGDILMVKGSKSMHMEYVVAALRGLQQPDPQGAKKRAV